MGLVSIWSALKIRAIFLIQSDGQQIRMGTLTRVSRACGNFALCLIPYQMFEIPPLRLAVSWLVLIRFRYTITKSTKCSRTAIVNFIPFILSLFKKHCLCSKYKGEEKPSSQTLFSTRLFIIVCITIVQRTRRVIKI